MGLIYNWIVAHLPLLGFIVAAINIVVTLVNWHISRPRIEFYKSNFKSVFKRTTPSEYGYLDSHCIVFSYVSVANLSSNPCTISQFELVVKGYESCFFRAHTAISDKYILKKEGTRETSISGDVILSMPCTIAPYGYAEGVLIFPFAPTYKERKISGEIIARTAKKDFRYAVELNHIE